MNLTKSSAWPTSDAGIIGSSKKLVNIFKIKPIFKLLHKKLSSIFQVYALLGLEVWGLTLFSGYCIKARKDNYYSQLLLDYLLNFEWFICL